MTPDDIDLPVAWGELAGLRVARPGRPRVIALHGWLDNAASFLPLLPHLPDLDLLLLDLPGHGHSAHLPVGAEYGLTTHLYAVLDAADALGWESFTLLGHSMGAAIATLVAAAVPSRVERLALIETLGPLAEPVETTAARLQQAVAVARARPAGAALRVFPDLAVAVRARMQASQLDEANARLLVERGTRPVEGGRVWRSDPRLTRPAASRLTESQVAALLSAITCPVRLLYADPAQPYFPEPVRQARLAAVRHAELNVVPGGHHLHMDQPAVVADFYRDFLAP
ncbi:alpha/beta fold hydrolase [Pseudoxanthomonas daejeonensis]|uniref:Alpha/beta hydrolase n=1 Tax=Pseudoxanthomonas daejeonensis TaxID=266062 RepID=A0ABQ6Z6V1_9GAMM|nr:alpha/beta hydrolase [Pseudoxanthomonas daejeonensis]KAF1694394.1 alpha/beta hydrolase [Pseudoxanthomonas daejeonensis]